MPILASFATSGLASKLLHSSLEQPLKLFRSRSSGGVVGSTDGVTWTTVPTSTSSTVHVGDWAYGNGIIITSGSAGPLNNYYSISLDNGLTWDTAYLPTGQPTTEVSFVDGYFYMPGTGTDIYRSADGLSWTLITGAVSFVGNEFSTTQYTEVVKIGGRLVIPVPGTSKVQTSTNNGVTWTASANNTIPISDFGWRGVYNSSIAVIYSSDTQMAYSTDGLNWTQGNPPAGLIRGIAYGNGKFIGAGYYENLFESTDGINWTTLTAPGYLTGVYCTFADGKFYLVDYLTESKIYSSTNGTTWSTITNTGGSGPIFSIA